METPAPQLQEGLGVGFEGDNFSDLRKKLFSLSPSERDLKEPVAVYLRIRPKSLEEIKKKDPDCLHSTNKQELIAVPPESSNTYKVNRSEENSTQTFSFSRIFPAETTQKDLFEETLRPRLRDFCEGQDCLLFTYGVTNSGKSYTIVGTPSEPGLLPRALDVVFNSLDLKQIDDIRLVPERFSELRWVKDEQEFEERLKWKEGLLNLARSSKVPKGLSSSASSLCSEQNSMEDSSNFSMKSSNSTWDSQVESSSLENFINVQDLDSPLEVKDKDNYRYAVFISFAEIYNNLVFDLLEEPPESGKHRPSLKIQQDRNQNNFVKGLQEVPVCGADEAMLFLNLGLRHRHVAATKLNYESSRGHAIFTIKLVQLASCVQQPTTALISRLCVVDLAGAERSVKTGATGARMIEANNINKDLFTLGRCIRSLMDNQGKKSADVVPFRDTNLTKLFQNHFVGKEGREVKRGHQGIVTMFVNISNNASAFDNTLHVLKFSAIASKVVPTVKSVAPPPSYSSLRTVDTPYPATKVVTRPGPPEEPAKSVTAPSQYTAPPSQCTRCLELQRELLEYQQTMDRQLRQMEYELRKELCQEFSEKLVEIEKEHKDELAETQEEYESLMEERIRAIQKSVKKSRKRRRAEDDDIEEGNKENLVLSEMEARVRELEDNLSTERSIGEKYKAEIVSLHQQIAEQSSQLTEARKKEAQLTTTTDTLHEQVRLALQESKTSSGNLQELQSDLAAKERALVAAKEAARRDCDSLQQMLDVKDKHLRNLEEEVSASKVEVRDMQRQLQQVTDEKSERDRQVVDLEKMRSCLEDKVKALEGRIVSTRGEGEMEAEILQERISELQRDIEMLSKREGAEKAVLQDDVARLEEQLKASDQSNRIEDLLRQVAILEEKLVMVGQEDAVGRLKARVSELEEEVSSLTNDKMEVTKKMDTRIAELTRERESDCSNLQRCNVELQRSMEELQADKDSLASLCRSLRETESGLRTNLLEVESENKRLTTLLELKAQAEGNTGAELKKLSRLMDELSAENEKVHGVNCELEQQLRRVSKELQDRQLEDQEEVRKQRRAMKDLEEEKKHLLVACEDKEQRIAVAEASVVQVDEARKTLERKYNKLLEKWEECKNSFVKGYSEFLEKCSQFDESSKKDFTAMNLKMVSLVSVLEGVRSNIQSLHKKLIDKEEERTCLESELMEQKTATTGLAKVAEILQAKMSDLKSTHKTEMAAAKAQYEADVNDMAAQVCDLQQRLEEKEAELQRQLELALQENIQLNLAREESEEHIYEEPPELTTLEEDTIYDSVLDDTVTSKGSKSVKFAESFTESSYDLAVDCSVQSVGSTTELDRSKPYVPVLERSSQLVEDSEVDPTRPIIDANPMPLKKKAARRKRKLEGKTAVDQGPKRGKYQLRSRNKNSSSVTPPPESGITDHQSPTHQSATPNKTTVTLPEASDYGTPTTLGRLKKGWTSGKKALAGVTRSKRKLRKQDAAPLMSVESPMEKRATRRADIRLGGKLRSVQQT